MSKPDELAIFQEAYLDYLEGDRPEPPSLDNVPGEEERRKAELFVLSIKAARGIDPYAERPSIEQLLKMKSGAGTSSE